MARNEVDASLIVNEPRKRRIPSYITNDDNNSADKAELIKRLKTTFNLEERQTSSDINEESNRTTHPSGNSSRLNASKACNRDEPPPQKLRRNASARNISVALTHTSSEPDVGDGQSSEQDIDEVEPEAQEEDAEQQLGNYK
jgi:hypothetical protein